ncbi:helix-turn-helix transcriptional regulator [Chengkuizengella sediminis]|uniref:helix-turn-helix transcriptional regulator n=1 Tax=Chengkuizengella sediminis TaxID=1885917 RepID=UPI00138A15AE|nr:AraC family transcriptional regulator [Chengkuizengella sediminis]NDI35941.1 helix-turn-helix transcriptional regulator [Chengkuizengella sediminis]
MNEILVLIYQNDTNNLLEKFSKDFKVEVISCLINIKEKLLSEKYKLLVFMSPFKKIPSHFKLEELAVPVISMLGVGKLQMVSFLKTLKYINLVNDLGMSLKEQPHSPLFYESLVYIEENLCSNDLSLKDVANTMFVSHTHYSRFFRRYMGKGFKKYITEKRIQKAKFLLESNLQVTDVCYEIGYTDLTHFARTFKKLVGVNPSQYKKIINED